MDLGIKGTGDEPMSEDIQRKIDETYRFWLRSSPRAATPALALCDACKSWIARNVLGWEAARASLYDEEGVEGWHWSDASDSWDVYVIGDWSEPPAWDDDLDNRFSDALALISVTRDCS